MIVDLPQVRYEFLLFSTDTGLIFTKPKIATTYLRSLSNSDMPMFSSTLNNIHDFKYLHKVGFHHPNQSNQRVDYSHILDTINNDVNLLVNNNLKKDVVILYRNPIKRCIAAFVQDNLHDLLDVHFHKKEISIQSDVNLLDKLITGRIKLMPRSSHNTPWLVFVNELINSSIIDKSKLKLIDIDSGDISNTVKKYFNNHEFHITKNSNKFINNRVYYILKNFEKEKYNEMYQSHFDEIAIYNKLKSLTLS
jgi:hypothetical protein